PRHGRRCWAKKEALLSLPCSRRGPHRKGRRSFQIPARHEWSDARAIEAVASHGSRSLRGAFEEQRGPPDYIHGLVVFKLLRRRERLEGSFKLLQALPIRRFRVGFP